MAQRLALLSTLMPINLSRPSRDKRIGFLSVRVARYRRETFETTVFARRRRKKTRDMEKDDRRERNDFVFGHEEDVRQRCALHFDRITTSVVAQDTPDICHSHHRDR